MTSRELNIEIFPVFYFCVTFLHYLFDRESWRETWRLFGRKSWRKVMIESHEGKTWRSFDRKSWREIMIESHEGETWRLFDRKSWREVMIESHDEKTWRLFDRESWRKNKLFTTIYLSLCLDESNREFKSILDFNILTQLKYLIQTSWLNLNTWFQNFDSNWVLTSRELDLISIIRLDVISLIFTYILMMLLLFWEIYYLIFAYVLMMLLLFCKVYYLIFAYVLMMFLLF